VGENEKTGRTKETYSTLQRRNMKTDEDQILWEDKLLSARYF
jgi:hypothetical protein